MSESEGDMKRVYDLALAKAEADLVILADFARGPPSPTKR